MDRAAKVVMFVVIAGVVLYFVPFAAKVVGFEVSHDVVRVPASILYSFDGGTTFHEGVVRTAGILDSQDFNVTSFAFDPVEEGIVYAGTAGNGILISDDGGKNWYAWSDPKHVFSRSGVFEEIFVPTSSRVLVLEKRGREYVVLESTNAMKTARELVRFSALKAAHDYLFNRLGLRRDSVIAQDQNKRLVSAATQEQVGAGIFLSLREKGVIPEVVGINPKDAKHVLVGRVSRN